MSTRLSRFLAAAILMALGAQPADAKLIRAEYEVLGGTFGVDSWYAVLAGPIAGGSLVFLPSSPLDLNGSWYQGTGRFLLRLTGTTPSAVFSASCNGQGAVRGAGTGSGFVLAGFTCPDCQSGGAPCNAVTFGPAFSVNHLFGGRVASATSSRPPREFTRHTFMIGNEVLTTVSANPTCGIGPELAVVLGALLVARRRSGQDLATGPGRRGAV